MATPKSSKFTIGDLVWAKMKGFSPWPAKVVEPTKDVKRPSIKKPMQCVFFFGTDNYAWVQNEFIKPYDSYKEQYMKQNKSGSFKEAIEAIEDFRGNKDDSFMTSIKTKSPLKRPSSISSNASSTSAGKKSRLEKSEKSNSVTSTPADAVSTPQNTGDDLSNPAAPISPNGSLVGGTTEDLVAAGSQSTPALPATEYTSTYSPIYSPQFDTPSKTSMGLLSRPSYVTRPETPPLDVEKVSDVLKQKHVVASDLKFGFLGLGIMGQGIVKNLINSGHTVVVWNRTPSKCRDFMKAGATKGQTPADVVAASDITFCCVSDPQAAKEMVFGNCGVLQEIGRNKGYVEMTSIDPETSQDIAEAILARNGRYLEAPVSGNKKSAEEGMLIILAAGDRTLFSECTTCFQAMGKHAFYLGDVGNGSKMNLTLNMLLGTTLASLAEAMALADRAGLSQKDLVEILELGDLSCSAIVNKGQTIIEGTFPTSMPLQHMQKDLRLALSIGDNLEQPLPLAASACEVFKHAKRMGYSEHDVSAVYVRARF